MFEKQEKISKLKILSFRDFEKNGVFLVILVACVTVSNVIHILFL